MVQVQLEIDASNPKKLSIKSNIFSREDATPDELEIAQNLEGIYKELLIALGSQAGLRMRLRHIEKANQP